MYYLYADSLYPGTITATISGFLKIDNNEQSVIADDPTNVTNDEQSQPPRKHRKYAAHILKVTPDILYKRTYILY